MPRAFCHFFSNLLYICWISAHASALYTLGTNPSHRYPTIPINASTVYTRLQTHSSGPQLTRGTTSLTTQGGTTSCSGQSHELFNQTSSTVSATKSSSSGSFSTTISQPLFNNSTQQRLPYETGAGSPITAKPHISNSASPFWSVNASTTTNSSLFSSCASAYDSYYHGLQSAFLNLQPYNRTYTRPAVCKPLLQDYCLIWVDGVDLLYWPTPYATGVNITKVPVKEVPSTLVSDGYTFESQSAYLVYKNAKAILPYRTDKTTTGPSFTSLTIAYPTQSLSTYYNCNPTPSFLDIWPFTQINFEDFNRPPRWSVVSTQRPCHLSSIPGDSLQNQIFPPTDIATQYTDYYNKPLVLLPAPLNFIDPAWATCSMGDTGIGLYDPPRAIMPASAMVATATMTSAIQGTAQAQEGAQPAVTVSDTAPAQTSVVFTLANGDRIVDFLPASTAKAGSATNYPMKEKSSDIESSTNAIQGSTNAAEGPTTPSADDKNPSSGDTHVEGSPQAAENESAPASSGSDSSANPEPAPLKSSQDSPSVPPGSNSSLQDDSSASEGTPHDNQNAPVVDPNPSSAVTGDGEASPNPDSTHSHSQNAGYGSDQSSVEPASVVMAGGHTIDAAANGGVAIDGTTLNSANPISTANNVQVSLSNAGVVFGGNHIAIPQLEEGESPPLIAIDGHTVQVLNNPSGNQIIVDNHILPPGISQASVGSQVISLINHSEIYVVPTTLPYVPLAPSDTPPLTTAPNPSEQPLTPYLLPDNAISIAGKILTAGGPAATISGMRISILPQNAGVIIGQKTVQPIPTPAPKLGIVIDGTTLTPLAGSGVAADGTTISRSEQTLVLSNGKVITLRQGKIVLGSRTFELPHAAQSITSLTSANSHSSAKGAVQTLPNGDVEYEGVTLSKGGHAITLSNGEVVSLEGSAIGTSSTLQSSVLTESLRASPSSPTSGAAEGVPTPETTITATAAATSDGGILGMGAVHDGRSAGDRIVMSSRLMWVALVMVIWMMLMI